MVEDRFSEAMLDGIDYAIGSGKDTKTLEAEFCKPYWMERGGIGFVNHMVTQYINNDEQSIVEYLYNLDEENKQLVIKYLEWR